MYLARDGCIVLFSFNVTCFLPTSPVCIVPGLSNMSCTRCHGLGIAVGWSFLLLLMNDMKVACGLCKGDGLPSHLRNMEP